MRKRLLALLILTLLVLPLSAQAQRALLISGQRSDILATAAAANTTTTYTVNLPPGGVGGTVYFTFSAAGYAGATITVTVGSDDAHQVTVLPATALAAVATTQSFTVNATAGAVAQITYTTAGATAVTYYLAYASGGVVAITGTVTVAGTVTANQGTGAGAAAPWSVRLSDGAAFYVGTQTGQLPAALVGGRLDVNVGAALPTGANIIGAVTGASADNSANAILKLPTLSARANAAAPAWAEGNQVPLSVDLSGSLRTVGGGGGGTSSTFGAAFPATGTAIGFTDGTNMQGGRVFDVDTGAGVQFVQGVQIRIAAAGGSVAPGGDANGLFVQGPAGNAGVLTGNPVRVAGRDTVNGLTRDIATDGGGRIFLGFQVTAADAVSNANINNVPNAVNGGTGPLSIIGYIFNGTNWDRQRSASLANFPVSTTLTGVNSIGAALSERGARWTVNSAPLAGTQASASIAAEIGVRHVAHAVCFSSGSTAAPALTSLQVNIRDGATGVGTVLMSFEVEIPAATGANTPPFCTPPLNLAGTTNTAMTAEWNAGLANLRQTVTLTGFNVI